MQTHKQNNVELFEKASIWGTLKRYSRSYYVGFVCVTVFFFDTTFHLCVGIWTLCGWGNAVPKEKAVWQQLKAPKMFRTSRTLKWISFLGGTYLRWFKCTCIKSTSTSKWYTNLHICLYCILRVNWLWDQIFRICGL